MKIHLVATPDVHPLFIDEVLEILNSVSGPMIFSKLEMKWEWTDLLASNQTRFSHGFHFRIESEYKLQQFQAARGYPLSWRELFYLCETAREKEGLAEEDFVVLITNRRNSMNFFSMFDVEGRRNSFVQCSDWELFLKAPESLPVAYEVVSDVLRILMKFELSDKIAQTFHRDPIGCMNDFCADKKEIILKMRTADVCQQCLEKIQENEIPDAVVLQSLNIFEAIRGSLKFSQGFVGSTKPRKISVNAKGKIFLDEREIPVNPLQKTIFIFFLLHPEGVRIAELGDYEAEIFHIYQKVKANASRENIRNLVNIFDGNFNYNKSKLTKTLKEKIGEPLANYYCISGTPGEPYKIPLSEDFVEVDSSFALD